MSHRTPTLDISLQLETLSRSLVSTLPELAHIDLDRVLFTFSRSRRPGRGGLLARITPLRGKSGSRSLERQRGNYHETWEIPSLLHDDREILYLITILIPRFLHLEPKERLRTLLHELWHISPECDGDIRRFPGKRYAHGTSSHRFEVTVEQLTVRYLERHPDLPELLTLPASSWHKGQVRLQGLRVRRPRARLVARRKR